MDKNISKPIDRNLPVALTDSEQISFGMQLAELHAEYAAMEAAKRMLRTISKNNSKRWMAGRGILPQSFAAARNIGAWNAVGGICSKATRRN